MGRDRTRPGETALSQPDLPGGSRNGCCCRGRSLHGGRRQWRYAVPRAARADRTPNQLLVVAAPLKEADETLHRLLIVELAVAASVLAAVLLLGLWLVRVGLRPLGRIEHTAAAIAGGDLSQRVENDDPRTEVGRLGGALNTMLGQIEEAFDERTASENRLRRFIADASHELRTPLAAVRAYAELFDRGARERPDDLERAMTGIQRESQRMGLLVDDLLLLARLDQGRPLERKPVELEDVARDAVEAARTLDPGREIELDAPVPVEVQGDRERLRRSWTTSSRTNARTPCRFRGDGAAPNGGDAALIEVADAGPGLSDEQRRMHSSASTGATPPGHVTRAAPGAWPGHHLGDCRITRRLCHGRQQGSERRAAPDGSGRDPADGGALASVPDAAPAGSRSPAALARPAVPGLGAGFRRAPRGDHLRRTPPLRSCCHSQSATLRGQMMLEPIGPAIFLPGLAPSSPGSVAT